MNYEMVIGLEVHAQLKTQSKIFCSCSTEFGKPANENTCPVCLGMPGVLPVFNKKALQLAMRACLSTNCRIAPMNRFARKNYFYPDLPKGYQISQFELPLGLDGYVNIQINETKKKIGLTRIHMEGTREKKIIEIKTDHNWKFKKRLVRCLRSQGSSLSLNNIMKNHFELRLPLDSYDVKNTITAEKITGKGFVETLKNFNLFKSEYQVQGFLEGRMLEESPYGLSFPSIIASGRNATVLHYMKNDDGFKKNEMVLMDFGVRWMTMHADISRTVPASGKFNPMQKMLYEIVLKAQLAVQKTARRGITMNELNDCCWDSVNRDLEKTFKRAGGKMKLRYKDRPHGVSHLMGEQEHDGDPFRNYLSEPMHEGWLISNEPGLYGSFKIRLNGKLYDEEIGIRIEDNLLITKTGCKNLSSSIPKTVRQIEKLMATKSD